MSLTVENKTVTVGRGDGVRSFLAVKTEQKQRKGKAYTTNHPSSSLSSRSLHTFLHFFQLNKVQVTL